VLSHKQSESLCGSLSKIVDTPVNVSQAISFWLCQCLSDGDFSFPRFVGLLILSLWYGQHDKLVITVKCSESNFIVICGETIKVESQLEKFDIYVQPDVVLTVP
jgi:hypothetical protein